MLRLFNKFLINTKSMIKEGGEQMYLKPLIRPYELVFGIIGIIIGIAAGLYITINFINVV